MKKITLPLFVFLLCVLLPVFASAQQKSPIKAEDCGQWETLVSASSYGGFSPDGQWLAYAINRSKGNNERRIIKLADGTTTVAAFGVRPAFSYR